MNDKRFILETESHGSVIIKAAGKKGTYRVSFQYQGKHVKRSLKTSNKQVASERLPVVLAEYPDVPKNIFDAITFDQGLEYYIQSLVAKRRPEKTISQVRLRCNAFFEHLKSKQVFKFEKILAVHADTFYQSLQETKSDSTAFGYFRFVKAMLNHLESRELIERNPFFRVKFQRPEFQHSAIPNLPQVIQILKHVDPKFLVPISALAFMGCRREALTRILATDVDLDGGTINIRKPEDRTSKTVSRFVPIHRCLMPLLKNYERPKSVWYFCSPATVYSPGGKKIDADDLNEAFKVAAKKAGYAAGRKNKGFTVHCLRGFFKSHALMCGLPREIIDVIQGHKSDRSVGTRHYLQFTPEDLNRFMQMINFDSLLGELP